MTKKEISDVIGVSYSGKTKQFYFKGTALIREDLEKTVKWLKIRCAQKRIFNSVNSKYLKALDAAKNKAFNLPPEEGKTSIDMYKEYEKARAICTSKLSPFFNALNN